MLIIYSTDAHGVHPFLLSRHPSHIFSLLHVCAFYLF